ncbi:MAG: hypothetical protein ABFS08_12430 [Pseudomonadota bacterium]
MEQETYDHDGEANKDHGHEDERDDPGEAMPNAYHTTKVTPRTLAQVIRRHVRLGDHVKKGQPLVMLSSVEMAEAQGAPMETNIELHRVENLGRNVTSEKRLITAQIAYQQAYARVGAYGMTKKQVVGGLISSTLLTLFVIPALYGRFSRARLQLLQS